MIGETVENFILKDQNGNTFDLYENLDERVFLVVYPKYDSRVYVPSAKKLPERSSFTKKWRN